jgi:predicted ribosome quality control (RQC) complex YloA/Tae2 family protein
VQEHLELVVEWVGTRSAAFLVDRETREILDVHSLSTPRRIKGETYEVLEPPPGATSEVDGAPSFMERFEAARRKGLGERQAIRLAGGLSPNLAEDVWMLHVHGGITLDAAFETVREKLADEPRPILIVPSGSFRDKQSCYRTSLVSLSYRSKWERSFPTFNEAAQSYINDATRLAQARRQYQALGTVLRRKLKKHRMLLQNVAGDRKRLEDPQILRRRGELLLAGLSYAKKTGGEVVVPDPYGPEGALVRVPIDARRDIVQNADRYFERSRRAERSVKKLEARTMFLTDELRHLETLELSLENASGPEDLAGLVGEMAEEGLMPRVESGRAGEPGQLVGPRRFSGAGGCEILVGRSARSNEKLTFEEAAADDLWFHAVGVAGAHVLLRKAAGQDAREEQVHQAAAVAAYYSRARGSTSVEVMYTHRKNVRKIRKAPPGTVRVARFNSVRVKPALPEAISNKEK